MHLEAFCLIVPEYDSGITFFCDTLGFDLVEDILQEGKRWVRVRAPGAQTSIILARASTAEQESAIGAQGGGRVWLFLRTQDFDRDHSRLVAAGVHFEEDPRQESYGTVAVFRDPFGNRWDLLGPAI
ncbi:MAG: VOC family protein [Pseudomonadota bacterium]